MGGAVRCRLMSFEPVLLLTALFVIAIPVGAMVGLRAQRLWKPILLAGMISAVLAIGVVVVAPRLPIAIVRLDHAGWLLLAFFFFAWIAVVAAGDLVGRFSKGAGETRQLISVVSGVLLVPAVLAGLFTATFMIACSSAFGGQGCW